MAIVKIPNFTDPNLLFRKNDTMMNVSHYRTCGDASCILLNLMSDRAIGQALC